MGGFMEKIEFDVRLTAGDLYAFLMHHTYFSFSGISSLFASICCLVILALRFPSLSTAGRLLFLALGALFTLVQPIMLYFKAKRQARQNKNISSALRYTLTEDGITVAQGEQEGSIKWRDVRRRVQTGRAIYLYTSPVRAFIFPADQCGARYEQIGGWIRQRMEEQGREDGEHD